MYATSPGTCSRSPQRYISPCRGSHVVQPQAQNPDPHRQTRRVCTIPRRGNVIRTRVDRPNFPACSGLRNQAPAVRFPPSVPPWDDDGYFQSSLSRAGSGDFGVPCRRGGMSRKRGSRKSKPKKKKEQKRESCASVPSTQLAFPCLTSPWPFRPASHSRPHSIPPTPPAPEKLTEPQLPTVGSPRACINKHSYKIA